jgi:hypothetical protein
MTDALRVPESSAMLRDFLSSLDRLNADGELNGPIAAVNAYVAAPQTVRAAARPQRRRPAARRANG